jgi:hypothetical protein
MWLATKIGFYSIVKKEDAYGGATWHVRARVKGDLERLLEAAKSLESVAGDYPVENWPDADYRYRVRIDSKIDMAALFVILSDTIDYNNFKNTIADTPHQAEKCQAYGNLWSNLYGLQNDREWWMKDSYGQDSGTLQTYEDGGHREPSSAPSEPEQTLGQTDSLTGKGHSPYRLAESNSG